MVFLIFNHKTEIVLQILITYIAWTSAYAKSVSMPVLEQPSDIHHFGSNNNNKGVMHYNVNPRNPRNYYKRFPNAGKRMAPASFHNDVLLPPQMHQIQPHHHGPPNVYTMDPVLGAPNPVSDSHQELK